MAKRKGPTPKRKPMVKCLECGHMEVYPHYGDCPKCKNPYGVNA